jgi:hypothetical protein
VSVQAALNLFALLGFACALWLNAKVRKFGWVAFNAFFIGWSLQGLIHALQASGACK